MSTSSYAIGQRLRITRNIYEPPNEHAPGGYLALKGDTVVVRRCTAREAYPVAVSHENYEGTATFLAAPDEVEPLP